MIIAYFKASERIYAVVGFDDRTGCPVAFAIGHDRKVATFHGEERGPLFLTMYQAKDS